MCTGCHTASLECIILLSNDLTIILYYVNFVSCDIGHIPGVCNTSADIFSRLQVADFTD